MTALAFLCFAFIVAPRFMLLVTGALLSLPVWIFWRVVRRLGE